MNDMGRIRDALSYLDPAMPRDDWVKIAMALKSSLGEGGFETFDTWSQQADSYNAKDALSTWKSVRANGKVTAGTLFYEAKVNGWRDDGSHPKPTPEELAERRRQAAERAAKEEAEKHARYEAAAAKAAKILAVATDDPTTHSYAIKKRVSFGPLVKRGAWPQRGWPDALLVPIYGGDGRLWSIEAINADGAKDSLKDGRKTGGFHPLGTICGASRVLISEGLANAAVGGAVDGSPAAAAMGNANLLHTALAVRKLALEAEIIILADNDLKVPRQAQDAARAVGGRVAVPDLGGREYDFWDLRHERGVEAIHDLIYRSGSQEKGTKPPGGQEDIIEAAIAKLSADIGAIFEPQVIEALKAVRVQPRRLPALSEAHQGCGRSCFGARSPGVCDWERGHGRGPRRRSPHRAREGPQWGRGSSAGHSCERWRAPAARFGRH
jgi:hypothetical protein